MKYLFNLNFFSFFFIFTFIFWIFLINLGKIMVRSFRESASSDGFLHSQVQTWYLAWSCVHPDLVKWLKSLLLRLVLVDLIIGLSPCICNLSSSTPNANQFDINAMLDVNIHSSSSVTFLDTCKGLYHATILLGCS